jgi:hypothetical protein
MEMKINSQPSVGIESGHEFAKHNGYSENKLTDQKFAKK